MTTVTRICFVGLEAARPVIPLAYACGVGSSHVYVHRENAIRVLQNRAPSLWKATSLGEAELVVYPHTYGNRPGAIQAETAAATHSLPCLFFEHSDDENPSMPGRGLVWRTALDARRRRPRELAMSGLSDDLLLREQGRVALRDKASSPVVGFCGNTGGVWGDLRDLASRRFEALRGTRLRRHAIRQLERTSGVTTNLLPRTAYWGGAFQGHKGDPVPASVEIRSKLREEFVGNITGSDYTLCVRGAGNYSIRFYEVLSAGRIPLFVNSHCVLPFDDIIDWRHHCVWVDETDLCRLGEKLLEFHETISSSEFHDLQRENRRLWEDWLEATAFYQRAIQHAVASSTHVRTGS